MPAGAQLFLVAVVTLAAFFVAHVALVVRILRAEDVVARDRWLSLLLPFCTPYFGWRTGKRKHVIGWACLIVLYAVVRAALRG